jgi:hypothetical protein
MLVVIHLGTAFEVPRKTAPFASGAPMPSGINQISPGQTAISGRIIGLDGDCMHLP